MAQSTEADWVSRFADEVIAEAERRAAAKSAGTSGATPGEAEPKPGPRTGAEPTAGSPTADSPTADSPDAAPGARPTIVCASGLSPSGPIHLGNLREVMTPHLVADEIKRRGYDCVHLLSWDDYDRFRKVPAGVDPSWSEHIGKPLTSVPAPPGSPYPNWAEHFKAPMVEALRELGVEYHPISQTEQYTSGAYREQILFAMRERHRIDAVLDRYRTKDTSKASGGPAGGQRGGPGAKGGKQSRLDAADQAAANAAAEGSGAAGEDDSAGSADAGYFPYKPYCARCERDLTTVTAYDDETTELTYRCVCGFSETVRLSSFDRGKLVWKVDWPMRWAYEGVVFEPSGVDHSSPGSSYVVGGQLVTEVFGGQQPIGPMYAFVGISGMAKMSSSRGGVPTPADALEIMEAPLLRWLYARRRPNQSFKIAFDQEIQRTYDEWDALCRKVADGSAQPADLAAHRRATHTATGELPRTPRPLPFRTLASVADITTGNAEQTLRILRELDPQRPVASLEETRPRLDRAERWITTQVPADQRTRVRDEPDTELLAGLDDTERQSLRLLLEGLDRHWSLEGLTTLVYGVPKIQAGFSEDAKPTQELKAAQRRFFVLLYRLLVGRDTGPRLPTLLLAVGADRVRKLLAG